jgi:LysR family transcriptional regulator, nitrogen assimilation regulatory protein
MLDIRTVHLFVAVYEAGSITKAAEREHIAQPALTVRLQQLEDELNVKLFERSPQGVTPTPAGRHFYGLCLDLLKRLDAVAAQMARFNGAVAGSITAGIMPSICHGPLAPMLACYTKDYPNVEVRIVEGLSGTLAGWVLSGEVDFAICNRPVSRSGLESRLLLSDRLVLVSARGAAFKPFAPCKLSQITSLKLVLPSRQHTLRNMLDQHIDRGDLRPVTTLEIDGQSATLQFVAHSDWSTILPAIALINEFDSHRFTINPIDAPNFATEIYELRSSRQTPSLAAEHFVSMLEASMRSAPSIPSPDAAA